MDEPKELVSKATPSAPPIENPSSDRNPPKAREEGELSSSEGDDNDDSHGAGSLSVGHHPAPLAKEMSRSDQAGGSVGGDPPIGLVGVSTRTFVQRKQEKRLGMNLVPRKSVRSGTGALSGANSDLVISFSDDEDSSSSDEGKQESRFERKGRTVGMNGNPKPPSLTQTLSKKSVYPIRDAKQVISHRLSSSRAFRQSRMKDQGANCRFGKASSVGRGSTARSLGMPNQSQEGGSDQTLGLRNLELLDLRQQIAQKESELKLNSLNENKPLISSSFRDNYSLNLNRDSDGRNIDNNSYISISEPREPPSKRLKVGASSYAQRCPEQDTTIAKLHPPLKEMSLENKMGTVGHSRKATTICMTEPGISRCETQDYGRVDVAAGNQHGTNAADYQEKISRVVNAFPLSNNNMLPGKMAQNLFSKNTTNDRIESGYLAAVSGNNSGVSSPNRIRREHELVQSSKNDEVLSQNHALEVAVNKPREGSLKNVSTLGFMDDASAVTPGIKEMQSLVEIEESLDKKLEDAQEHRRKCEFEERNALKAYRKAQRVLIEANAKCAQLYRQRELYSARLQSFMMDDAGLIWSSVLNNGIQRNSLNHECQDMDARPSSSHHIQDEYGDQSNRPGYASSIQCLNGVLGESSHLLSNGQRICLEPCSEPDVSTSEPISCKGKTVADGECSPLNGTNISMDGDEDFIPLAHDSVQLKDECHRKGQQSEDRCESMTNEANRNTSGDSPCDYLLEATLRSELFAKWRRRSSQSCRAGESAIEQGHDSDIGSEKTHLSNVCAPFSDMERPQHSDVEGIIYQDGCEYDIMKEGESMMDPINSSTSIFRSPFSHVKDISSIRLSKLQKQQHTCDVYNDEGDSNHSWSSSLDEIGKILFVEDTSSYSCNTAVDPHWPLCMYDLRGKCNDVECPWQHIKDCSDGKMPWKICDSNDCYVDSALHAKRRALISTNSKCATPTYHVGLDVLKVDADLYEKVVSWALGQCWTKFFSISLVISRVPKHVHNMCDSILQNADGRIEINGCRARKLSYFQNTNSTVNQIKQASVDDQSLETALLLFNQDSNKVDGKIKVLTALSHALEADPTSVVLWSIYLVIFYSEMMTAGKDDMYYYAVKYNQGSYKLWLMYINSRIKLEDRFRAYEDALLAICRHSSASNAHVSACALDLFLQMMDCFCMSGNMNKAIQIVCEQMPSATNCDKRFTLLLSSIVSCLTLADTCIFWICCVYLVIYRKLPGAIVQQFEFEKELLSIAWPPVHLRDDDNQRATELMEWAAGRVESGITEASLSNEANMSSVHHFAANHYRCMVALKGLDCGRLVLNRYEKMHPTSLELVLISAREAKYDPEDFRFSAFENALSKWPKEVPGFQCIWNQYAEWALKNGRMDLAKDIMQRWFLSVWRVRSPHDDGMDLMDRVNSCSLKVTSASDLDALKSSYSRRDEIFGLFNLSLHKLLEKQNSEARMAIDKALHVATTENYKYCVREHAKFLLIDESRAKEGAQISWILDAMNSYVNDVRAFPLAVPLPRKFIEDIKRPRVQQLVKNIFCPVSSNFSLVNLVLESWCGPSLLPLELASVQNLVDFVEALLEISPSNYLLAFSVCKFITRDYKSTAVTSASLLFWASSLLVSTVSHAVPVAPEYVWVEAAGILENILGFDTILDGFFTRALSIYPFSIKLWKSFCIMKAAGDMGSVLRVAEEKGIKADSQFLSTIIM